MPNVQKPKLSDEEIKLGMKYSIKDGATVSARDSIFSNFTIPFALALGAGTEAVGFITALPQLATSLFAPFIGNLIERARSRKELCTTALLFSHLLWLPVAILPLLFLAGAESLWMFALLITAAQLARSIGSIAWSTWIADIVPEKIRGKFFAKRNMAASAAAFCATLFGGWLLGLTDGTRGFAALFVTAVFFGLISYWFLKRTPDIKTKGPQKRFYFEFSKIPKIFRINPDFKNYTVMAAIFNFAVYLAAPFFAVYMLREMNIGYEWFSVVVATEVMTMILAQRYWGRLADRFGDRPVMAVCGALVSLYPAMWLFISQPWHILFAAVLSGIAWAGFDITSFNYLLDVTPEERRHFYICDFKMFTNLGIVAGPIAGGFLAAAFAGTAFLWMGGIQLVFLLSFLLRGASIAFFLPRLKEVRVKKRYHIRNVFWKSVAVYPVKGAMHDVVTIFHALHRVEQKIEDRERRLFKGPAGN
ncbi:MAG: MFS transporter [Candidatus Aenigmatarchaeota archaeon]